jgi:hypothetical protein
MLKRRAAKNRTKLDEKDSSELALPFAARRCRGAGGDAPSHVGIEMPNATQRSARRALPSIEIMLR